MIPTENSGNPGENDTMLSTAHGYLSIHLFSTGKRTVNTLGNVSAFKDPIF